MPIYDWPQSPPATYSGYPTGSSVRPPAPFRLTNTMPTQWLPIWRVLRTEVVCLFPLSYRIPLLAVGGYLERGGANVGHGRSIQTSCLRSGHVHNVGIGEQLRVAHLA